MSVTVSGAVYSPRVTAADRDRLRDKLLALKTEILSEGDVAIEPVRKDATDAGATRTSSRWPRCSR